MKLPPLSLYVHLPWCAQKCPYCDFNSYTAGERMPRRRYLDALEADLDRESKRAAGRRVETVFLGGGTPSLFEPAEIERLLRCVAERLDLDPAAEVTMEANPGTVECGSPSGYRAAGVNRLSIGGQSLHGPSLRRLGRIHSSDDVRRVVDDARVAGFDNLNIDLMHGLPAQDVDAALDDLAAVIELGPEHISWYQLTIEPNTVFFTRRPPGLPDEDAVFEMEERGRELLAAAGYRQYEVSAYARNGRACRHNMNYWLYGDYIGAGAGAHGKLTNEPGVFRYSKPANPLAYMQAMEDGAAPGEPRPVAAEDRLFEFMLNALRLDDGFPEALFCERTGLELDALGRAMAPALARGLVERTGEGTWRPTGTGRCFLNDLQASFLPETG